jgi:hypothetical protein
MIDRWRIVAGLGCVAMGGLLAAEVTGGGLDPDIAVATQPAAPSAVTPAERSTAPASPEIFVDRILARPLFTANRQPARQESGSVRSGTVSLRRRLTGVVIEAATREAVFAGEGRARGSVVREGDDIEGWTVEAVTAEGVTVRSAGGSENLPLPGSKEAESGATAGAKSSPSFSGGQSVTKVR